MSNERLAALIADALDDALGLDMEGPHRRDSASRLADALAPHVVLRDQLTRVGWSNCVPVYVETEDTE